MTMKTPAIKFPDNIYHYCKRNWVDRDLLNISYSDESRRLGSLPYDWLKNQRSWKYARITRKIDKILRNFAVKGEAPMNDNKFFENFYKDFKFVKKMSRILKRNDIKIEYIDEGAYKFCHKLTVGDFDYALLTFKREVYPGNQLEWDTLRGCGALVEPCRIFDLYKEYSHGRVAKPFMTRFVNNTKVEEFDAYMLMKFIDKDDTSRAKSTLPELQKKFNKYEMTDFNLGNIINGIIVDIGRIEKSDEYMNSSEFRQNLFNILGKIERNHEENFNTIPEKGCKNIDERKEINKAIHYAEDFIYSLMDKKIDIYNVDIREHIKNLSPLEQKYVIKKIRKLKKAHNLKLKLKQSGEYEKYKQVFENIANTFGSWTMRAELLDWKEV